MRNPFPLSIIAFILLFATPSLAQAPLDTAKIEQVFGIKGTLIPGENVFKITKARSDGKVQVDGQVLPPFMGLGSWAAFTPAAHGGTMVMGDTVVFEDEVNPAMSAALDNGLEVTALHNHFFFDGPRSISCISPASAIPPSLAAGVKTVWDKIVATQGGEPRSGPGFGALRRSQRRMPLRPDARKSDSRDERPSRARHVQGRHRKSSHHAWRSRSARRWASTHGQPLQDATRSGHRRRFRHDRERIAGGAESHAQGGINIVAIHQHMSGESPAFCSCTIGPKADAATLAQAFKHVLDAQAALAK